jgi:hypothetical protein
MPQPTLDAVRRIAEELTQKHATRIGGFDVLPDFVDCLGFSEMASRKTRVKKALQTHYLRISEGNHITPLFPRPMRNLG